jgi:hypothetical protein
VWGLGSTHITALNPPSPNPQSPITMRQHILRSIIAVAALALAAVLLPPAVAPAQDSRPHRVHLPLLAGGGMSRSTFGLEMLSLSANRGLDLVTATETRWVRRNALLWKDIEPVAGGGYNWDHPSARRLEQELVRASELGINLVLIVRGSPGWAVAPYTAGCAPISQRRYGDFARFLGELARRYGAPPYNLRYLEIGNEPDAPIRPDDSVFGCWGDASDPYYGGQAYGELLKVVAPAIKAANPRVNVLNGGLLLDEPYVEGKSKNTQGRFFEGVLRAGAGPHIDLVSFHTYTFWRTPDQPPLGPREDWRVAYIQGLLRAYGQPAKPLIRTEAALLCTEVTPECRWAQADLVARTYARTVRDQLVATLWYIYDDDGFHNTALIEPYDVFVPRPAYFAYRHAARMFNGAEYLGPIPGLPPAAEGYVFRRGGETVYVYWTDDIWGAPFALNVPAGAVVACTERDGGPMPCALEGGVLQLTAQVSPAFVSVR